MTNPIVASLEGLNLNQLRSAWGTLLGQPCPRLRSPDLLRLILAWRLQAREEGGLDAKVRRSLKRKGPIMLEGTRLATGTVLKREWGGKEEIVTVDRQGYAWAGETFPSLSAVAFAITGSRRNGPNFFGLRSKRTAR